MVKIKPSLYDAGKIVVGANLIFNLIGCSTGYKHTFEYKGKQYEARVGRRNAKIYLDDETVSIKFDGEFNSEKIRELNWGEIRVNSFRENKVGELILINSDTGQTDDIPNKISEQLSGLYPYSFGPMGRYGNIDFENIKNTIWEYNGSHAEDVPEEKEQLGKFKGFSEKYVGLFQSFKNSLQTNEKNPLGKTEYRRRQRDFANVQNVKAKKQISKVLGL